MLSGPSTRFAYKPEKLKRKTGYGNPVFLICRDCNTFIVAIRHPGSGRRLFVSFAAFSRHPALVYSFKYHGSPHYHEKDRPTTAPTAASRPKSRAVHPTDSGVTFLLREAHVSHSCLSPVSCPTCNPLTWPE